MQIELIKKVPVVEIDGKTCFVDTCYPNAFLSVGSDIQDFFGIPGLYVAGLESLKRYTKFDYPNCEIITSDDPIPLEGGTTVPIEIRKSGWLVKMTVGGVEGLRYIDTGAAYSYVHNIQPSLPVVEIADECGWFHGRFTAHIHRVPCEFAGHSFDILCGDVKDNREYVPPEGVVGYDFFATFTVVVDRVGGKMTFLKTETERNEK